MRYVVLGATGHLGRLTVQALLDRGAAADSVVAAGRDTARLAALAAGGVSTRVVDYNDPATLADLFVAGDRVLLISSSEVGVRVAQHGEVIAAAEAAGVALLAYTSIAHADTGNLLMATEHVGTEELLARSRVPHSLLRNSWYLENYTGQLPTVLEHGAVLGSAGQGRISAATRADYAAAAAAVLLAEDQGGTVYELGGDESFTLADLAEVIAQASGRPVTYRDLPASDYLQVLLGAGLPQPIAEILVDADLGITRGALHVDSGDLSRLIGRPTTAMADAVRAAVAELG